MPHHIQMPCTFHLSAFGGKLQRRILQKFLVFAGHSASTLSPGFKMLQLNSEDGPLDSLHPIIISDFIVVISNLGTVFAQRFGACCHVVVICYKCSAFSVGSEIFSRIKTET